MKTVLLISAGSEAVPGILFAKKNNLKTIVVDKNKNAPGFKYADYKIYSSTYDYENIIYNLDKNKLSSRIQGVLSLSADVPITIAKLGSYLKLRTISLKTARICSDKLKMKDYFKKNNINVPWYSEVKNLKFLEKIKNNFEKLIIKPVDNRGSRGVLLIDKKTNLDWAYDYSLNFSKKKKLIVEEYLIGNQISTESIVYKGKVYTPCFVDRNYRELKKFLPNIIENGGQQPTLLNKSNVKKIINLKEKATLALDINNSTSKGDMILSKNKPYVIEIAPRLSGGWLSTHQTYYGTGINFLKSAFKLSLKENLTKNDIFPKTHNAVVIRYFFSKPGKIIYLPSLKILKKNKNIKLIKFYYKKKQYIPPIEDHTNRLGFVIVSCQYKKEALKLANQIVFNIQKKIKIDG